MDHLQALKADNKRLRHLNETVLRKYKELKTKLRQSPMGGVNTETHLVATTEQAVEFMEKIAQAITGADAGELTWAGIVLEQSSQSGPWRLVIGVLPKESEE